MFLDRSFESGTIDSFKCVVAINRHSTVIQDLALCGDKDNYSKLLLRSLFSLCGMLSRQVWPSLEVRSCRHYGFLVVTWKIVLRFLDYLGIIDNILLIK
jgi:hypothetical protein